MSDTVFTTLIGIDWAAKAHEVCLLDHLRHRSRLQVPHSEDGIATFIAALRKRCPDAASVAVAIERPDHPIVDALLLHGFAVFAINPKQLDRFRDRHSVAGAKDDRLDAFVLADSLRTDLSLFHPISPPDETTLALRLTHRRYDALHEDLRRLANRLGQLLRQSSPHLLTLCNGADQPFLWELLKAAADPSARRLTAPAVTTILRRHHIRRFSPEQVLALLRAPRLQLLPGGQDALLESILALLPQLEATHQQLQLSRQRLTHLVADAGRDAEIIDSLKGADLIVTAAFLGEASDALRLRDLAALRARCGTAPVTKQSGNSRRVTMRYACNERLRFACFALARTAVIHDPWAKALYTAMRARGLSFARSLRGVADRLLKRLVACLRDDRLYSCPAAKLGPAPVSP